MIHTVVYYLGWAIINLPRRILIHVDKVAYGVWPKGPKIIVANHPTTSDPFILLTTTGEQMKILIHEVLFHIPVFGTILRLSGHIPVVANDGHSAYEQALSYLKKGISVLIFIEGGISLGDTGTARPRTGAVRLAYKSGAPIVPVGIGIVNKNVQYKTTTVRGKKEIGTWYFHGGYAMTIGKSFHVSETIEDRQKTRQVSQLLMENIQQLAEKSKRRILRSR